MQGGDAEDNKVEQSQIYLLAGIYLAFALIGPTIIFFFLDPLQKYGEEERTEQKVWSYLCQVLTVLF